MASPTTVSDFLSLVRKSGLLDEPTLAQLADQDDLPDEPFACAESLVKARVLTPFQAKQILAGRFRGLVLGPYRIERPLGKGGMGVVYLAEHAALNRKVAIKILTHDKGHEKLALERFQREARAAAALDHPNIVGLHDITQVSGVHFLVMEYVDGVNLESLVQQTGALHYTQVINYIAQAAAGLKHAHAKGFVHRDIKPANLMLSKEGTVKILDMGLTRSLANPKDDLTGKLDDEAVTGTADFLSPEQALGAPLDARSDLYSLGATFFALVTGRPPFDGSTAQKLAQHQIAPPPDLCKLQGSLPPELNEVVGRMMAKKPKDRYQSAQEVIDALAPWLATVPVRRTANDTATVAQTTRRVKAIIAETRDEGAPARKKWVVAAAAVAVLVLAVAGAWAAFGGGKKPADTAQAPAPTPDNPGPNPGTPNPVPKNPTGRSEVVYRLDLSDTKPFLQSNKGRTIENPQPPAGAPAGWHTHSWTECTHEFIAEQRNGRMALGIRLMTEPASGRRPEAMLYTTGIDVAPNREYVLRFEYQANGQYAGADVRFKSPNLKILGKMTPTNGDWVPATFRFRTGNTDKLQLEFHHYGPIGTGNELFLRDVELIDPEARPTESGASVFNLDLSKVGPFSFTYQDGAPGDPDWRSKVPNGIYLHCWKKESVAVFRAEVIDGRVALGLTNLNNDISSQMLLQFDEGLNVPLQRGAEYRLRLEYRTVNDAEGWVYVRNIKNGEYPSVASIRLDGTNGNWRTVETTFRRPADGKLDVCINNNIVGEGNTLYFRAVEVIEIGK
jgi:eukaryotic-like serine/threonine-protein kinase